jgi:hypothetical protein
MVEGTGKAAVLSVVVIPSASLTKACVMPNGLNKPGVPPKPIGMIRLMLPTKLLGSQPVENVQQKIKAAAASPVHVRLLRVISCPRVGDRSEATPLAYSVASALDVS